MFASDCFRIFSQSVLLLTCLNREDQEASQLATASTMYNQAPGSWCKEEMPNGVTLTLPTRFATTQSSQAKHVFSAGSWPDLHNRNRVGMKVAISYAWLRLLIDRLYPPTQ